MQSQNLQQSFTEYNAQADNITHIYLAKNICKISWLVDALKSTNKIACNNNLAIKILNYARNFYSL